MNGSSPAGTRTAIVTGASSGIGQACAHALLRDGWNVVLVGRREAALQAMIDQLVPTSAMNDDGSEQAGKEATSEAQE